MTAIQKINKINFDSGLTFENEYKDSSYDLTSTSLKTINKQTAQSTDKEQLISFYKKLIAYLNGDPSVQYGDYAAALSGIAKYVLTADDYLKLRNGEIHIKDFLRQVVQQELYGVDTGKEGYYIKLNASLQEAIDSLNNDVITPINDSFSKGTFFPSESIDLSYFDQDIQKEVNNFSEGASVITTTIASKIDADTDIGSSTAFDASSAYDFSKKPSVIVISNE